MSTQSCCLYNSCSFYQCSFGWQKHWKCDPLTCCITRLTRLVCLISTKIFLPFRAKNRCKEKIGLDFLKGQRIQKQSQKAGRQTARGKTKGPQIEKKAHYQQSQKCTFQKTDNASFLIKTIEIYLHMLLVEKEIGQIFLKGYLAMYSKSTNFQL